MVKPEDVSPHSQCPLFWLLHIDAPLGMTMGPLVYPPLESVVEVVEGCLVVEGPFVLKSVVEGCLVVEGPFVLKSVVEGCLVVEGLFVSVFVVIIGLRVEMPGKPPIYKNKVMKFEEKIKYLN